MSITRSDFEKSLAALDPSAQLDATGQARIAADGLTALLQFEPMPNRTLGGLLTLPQARVKLQIEGAEAARMNDFMRRFDIAFQRGGG